jgi:hypothetical protein
MVVTRRFLNKLNDCAPARHHVARRAARAMVAASAMVAAACGGGSAGAGAASPEDSAARHTADSAAVMAAAHDSASSLRLSPSADSVAPYLVFAPTGERHFVAAVRNSQWLLDVGRMDLDVRKDSAKARAFREAAPVMSPVAPRAVFRLSWAKGAEDVVVDSFSVYNGRIVMRVYGSAALDSAARVKGSPTAFALRAGRAAPPVATACELRVEPDSAAMAALTSEERRTTAAAQKSADSTYAARVAFVRDSLDAELRANPPPYDRLRRRMKTTSSQVRGCFGTARRALVVSVRAGDAEWVRERLVLIAPDGGATPLRVDDLRFHAHELLSALDADGDGVDDLAVKGTTHRAGGTAILRVDLEKKRAERLAAGFVWETF